ncbi:glycosyltransferase [Mesorhizobium sp. M1006]|uniref:glycosyltransferase family 4 protein n=1 Tax=Mesorhizobium sp. M1006 TaxID=2957048 RepID=UPI00333E130A
MQSADRIRGLRIGLFVSEWGGRFGGNISVGILADILSKAGASVTVLTQAKYTPAEDAEGGIEVLNLENSSRGKGFVQLWRRTLKLLASQDFLIVVGERPRLVFLLAQLWRPLVFVRLDTILTCPAGTRFLPNSSTICHRRVGLSCLAVNRKQGCLRDSSEYRQVLKVMNRRLDMALIRCFKNFAANSSACLKRHCRGGEVFYPPCPNPQLRYRLPPSRDIIFVGRVSASKGVLDAIRIFKRSKAAQVLHIVGDGPELATAERFAASQGVLDRVVFHGWISVQDRDKLLDKCAATLMCSKWDEAFGRIGPESFALGTPVVAYDVGGVSEWCRSPAGTLVSCGDIEGAAQAVDRLLLNEAEWSAASEASYKTSERFSKRIYGERWLKYIEKILNK